MSRPPELAQLLIDLKAEGVQSSFSLSKESKMVIGFENDVEQLVFTGEEAQLLLATKDSIARLYEVLDYPEESFIELHTLDIDPEVMGYLESWATTVDEM